VKREPTKDETAGMLWWNGLSERARAIWMGFAGSARPADAWELYKANPGLAVSVKIQESIDHDDGGDPE